MRAALTVPACRYYQTKSNGYGFINLLNHEDAVKALEDFKGDAFLGENVSLTPYSPDEAKPFGRNNLYVKNLPLEMTDEQLSKVFGEHGELGSVLIARDEAGTSKGFGFVCFKQPEDAAKALMVMNDFELNGNKLFVSELLKKSDR